MKFRLVEKFDLEEESREFKRYYSNSQRSKANHRGSGANKSTSLKTFYSGLGYTGELECHHIDPDHKGEMCVAPKGFNSAFHSYVNNLIETRFANAPNYKAELEMLADIDDIIDNLLKVRNAGNQVDIDNCISTLKGQKSSISATTSNILATTDPYVNALYRRILKDFINGKIHPIELRNYHGKVFYKKYLEKKFGIKF